MLTEKRELVSIYVEPSKRRWVVRDPDGHLWAVDSSTDGWDRRELYELTDDSELVPVPGHYRYMLQLPF